MQTEKAVKLTENLSKIQESVLYRLKYSLGKELGQASEYDIFRSVAYSVRDQIIDRMIKTEQRFKEKDPKRIYYLSIEFLIGRLLGNNLYNLGLYDVFQQSLLEMGIVLSDVRELEDDAALGNGGLGRLAACMLDSMATMGIPGFGYGINYKFGLFRQEIQNGYQKEKPDQWPGEESPWLIERPDEACIVPLYGRVVPRTGESKRYRPRWRDWKALIGVPHDMPVVGYGGETVNFLRLFSARSSDEFDMQIFNAGDYIKAVEQKVVSETVSKVLYPSDSVEAGRELRLIQEYFLVSCAMRDIVRTFRVSNSSMELFPKKVAIQLNDTHPALTVAELMRILLDENGLPWERAWEITTATLGYTNHTLLPEALEKWPVSLLEHVLPRHLQIIYEINYRFLESVKAKWSNNWNRLRRMSIIEEGDPKTVRMANLAIIGSHSVNGVSKLHTELLKTQVVPEFFELWSERFNNKTNGVTQRRWLLKSNPSLANLLIKTIGSGWITDLDKIADIEGYVEDEDFRREFIFVKQKNKEKLARIIMDTTRVAVDPNSLFDVQAKRIHEYKRQLLNVMHIIHEYYSLVEDGKEPAVRKTYIFSGKAAPGYWAAKQIIKLINNVANVINKSSRVRDWIKVVFIPDYRVSLAEKIIPAADLSEQISCAGTEASGTGNMKFAMNGALTIGTLDGANIEIMGEVGEENIYIFGLSPEEVAEIREEGTYDPMDFYNQHLDIKRVMDALSSDLFCSNEPGLFKWIHESILNGGDPYFHLPDLLPYIETHDQATEDFKDPELWHRRAVLNVARVGRFSSDRTVREYAEGIWNVKPVR
jgi:starch phosphorylase